MSSFTRRVTTAATTGALMLASTVATTSTASAAGTFGSKPCTQQIKLDTQVDATVEFSPGPGTKYTASGQLTKRTSVYRQCNKGSSGKRGSWGHVKVKSGAPRAKPAGSPPSASMCPCG
ncbi:hypothetical protein [Streptomyces clavuligerus]|uniref:hypothetical protein n=1 Tax=Streptomyces clavuligerus TaxID=1901 RepID=UPI00017FF62D|nr:hypothetical protein [Streptomyces clavuligerus]EDY49224.1 hypothetical protein SSCG_02252 [Streptomyces clavuligerus]WDN56135.1 hypothetical protein LL058_30210 [Streptomyces clavuligerus]